MLDVVLVDEIESYSLGDDGLVEWVDFVVWQFGEGVGDELFVVVFEAVVFVFAGDVFLED